MLLGSFARQNWQVGGEPSRKLVALVRYGASIYDERFFGLPTAGMSETRAASAGRVLRGEAAILVVSSAHAPVWAPKTFQTWFKNS